MSYNIHPIIVHFPIALLTVYTTIKVFPFEKWLPNFNWKHIAHITLFVGVAGAFFALSTGEIAEHLTRPDHKLVETHSTFATIATWMYTLVLVGILLSWLNKKIMPSLSLRFLTKFSNVIEKILSHSYISTLLAIVGFLSLLITGVLGGVMEFGTTADPLAPIILKILGINF